MSEQTRGYIYRILTAIGVVAIGYGLISADKVALWAALALTVLQGSGNALASFNTTVKKDGSEGGEALTTVVIAVAAAIVVIAIYVAFVK